VRVWNASSSPASLTIEPSGYSILEAEERTHIEIPAGDVDYEAGRMTASIGSRQWKTFFFLFNGKPSPDKKIGRKKIR
jgi:hypothetical protein